MSNDTGADRLVSAGLNRCVTIFITLVQVKRNNKYNSIWEMSPPDNVIPLSSATYALSTLVFNDSVFVS